MSHQLRKVAILGASVRLGAFIFRALHQSNKFDITVISRFTSKPAEYPALTKVVQAHDEYPPREMVQVFRDHDAVVLDLGLVAENHLGELARASVDAGGKRLIAFGYGADNTNKEAVKIFPAVAAKARAIDHPKSLEQPGWATQTDFFGITPEDKTAEILDDGNAEFSATTRDGIG
ncbi:isoflavone reductase like P3 [Fusarium sp. NRRL 52700]|nr:isoflavone reductase like P3 [Fusarium sp. NRRL 52700]